MATVSRTVNGTVGSTSVDCITIAMVWSARSTEPADGRSRPAIAFSRVDLPDPFGPITATDAPEGIPAVTPAIAVVPPYRTLRSATRSIVDGPSVDTPVMIARTIPPPAGSTGRVAPVIEAFEPEFMQRALIAGLLAVVATSMVGTWVVLRGLAFLGDALAHGVIPGIALAVLWGVSPIVGALAAAAAMAGLVSVVSSRPSVREDTGIGLLFVGMLSLGVVIISKARSFATEVTSLLFGDILGVTTADIVGQLVATAVVLVVTIVLYRPFVALTFNRLKAQSLGMRPRLAHLAMMVLLALSIVASFQAVGTLLVFGLLVGPPATASLVTRRIPAMMVVSMLVGALAVIAGLVISFHAGTAGGATMAGLSAAQFFGVLAATELRERLRTHGDRASLGGVG